MSKFIEILYFPVLSIIMILLCSLGHSGCCVEVTMRLFVFNYNNSVQKNISFP